MNTCEHKDTTNLLEFFFGTVLDDNQLSMAKLFINWLKKERVYIKFINGIILTLIGETKTDREFRNYYPIKDSYDFLLNAFDWRRNGGHPFWSELDRKWRNFQYYHTIKKKRMVKKLGNNSIRL